MNQLPDRLFDTLESAHEYVNLLAEVVQDVKKDLDGDLERGDGKAASRRQDAIRLAHYNLHKLEHHMSTSSRILNDLRSLRRLLFAERKSLLVGARPN